MATEQSSSPTWLETAQSITTGERRRDYGHPLYNFLRIAIKWNANYAHRLLPGQIITPLDVARDAIDMKTARDAFTYKDDNYIDTIGYSACVDAMDREMKERGYQDGIRAFERLTLGDYYALVQQFG